MDSLQQHQENLRTRGVLWTLGHLVYENNFARKLISPVVNLFKPDWVMVGNNQMFIDKNDRVVSEVLLHQGVWEKFETELFKKHLKRGGMVMDIGANIGYHTLIAAEIVGENGHVYAFEPLPKNFRLLKKNVVVNSYRNVTLVNKALSDKNGTGKLFLSREDNWGDVRIFNSHDKRSSINIKLMTLDSFFGQKIPQIDVMKMDVQGAEALVLKGSFKTIKKNKRLKLFTEFWPKALRLSGSSAAEYSKLLTQAGFKVYEIDTQNHRLVQASFKRLMKDYPEDSLYNADLLCIKQP